MQGQNLSGSQLLDKAIKYHDPKGKWPSFSGSFEILSQTPSKSDRVSKVTIDLPTESFSAIATRDSVTSSYIIRNNSCVTLLADSLRIAQLEKKPRRSHCETTRLYSNYYTYLYGLPMKLKDPGTILDEKVSKLTFKGKEYLVLKASYEAGVGSDIWFFYFDPETYAMEIYQFYKQDEAGKQKDDSGEYILLTEEALVQGIKMPKSRAWYYNKGDKYLGTDSLR